METAGEIRAGAQFPRTELGDSMHARPRARLMRDALGISHGPASPLSPAARRLMCAASRFTAVRDVWFARSVFVLGGTAKARWPRGSSATHAHFLNVSFVGARE